MSDVASGEGHFGPQSSGTDASVRTNVSAVLDKIGLTRAHKLIFVLVALGGLFDVFEQDATGSVGPVLHQAWGISTATIGLLTTVTFGALAVGAGCGGVLADLAGRKRLFTFNLAIYSLGGLICAFAPNITVLLIGRAVVGLGLGGELSVAITLLSEMYPTKFRGSAVSAFNVAAGGIGNALSYAYGLLVLGVLGNFFGGPQASWRWLFGILVLPALLVLVLRRKLPETPRYLLAKGHRADANRVLSILASGRLKNPNTVHTYLGEDTQASLRQSARLGDVFRGRYGKNTLILGTASWMAFGAGISVLTLIPLVLVERGISITRSLEFTVIINAGDLVGALVAAYLAYRVPRRLVTIPCALLACAFALLFGIASSTGPSALIFGGLFQCFALILTTSIWAWAPEIFPTRIRGLGSAIVVDGGQIGGAIMPLIASLLLTSYKDVGMFLMIAIMFVIMAVVLLFAPETHGRRLEDLYGEA